MPELSGLDRLLESGAIKKGDNQDLYIRRLPLGVGTLDDMLGGGLPLGRCVLSYGPESTGKTLLAQLVAAAVQRSEHPLVLYMDMERSYDEDWWKLSGVDTDKLLVSTPVYAEAAIDVMRGMLHSTKELGLIILDSIAAMTPAVKMDMNKSSEDEKSIGLLARVVTLMYQQIVPMLENRVIFLTTNQMRESITAYSSELDALPGGRAQRHYSHIILRTRRDSWITDQSGQQRLGFKLEIINRKNKVAKTADGDSITLPFTYDNQIDFTQTYIDQALVRGIIVRNGSFFKTAGKNLMGMHRVRQFFQENPEELELLKAQLQLP